MFSEEPDSIVDMLLDPENIYLKVDYGSKTVIDAWAMNVCDEVQPGKGNEEDEIVAGDVDNGSKTVIDAWAMNVRDEVQPGKGNEEDEIIAEDVAEVVSTETHVAEA